MDLLPTPEQEAITESVRALLGDLHQAGSPLVDELWYAAATQGWFALGLSESDGGAGYGPVEEVLLAVEVGRAMLPGPVLPTIVAAHLDPTFATGERRVALAEVLPSGELRVLDASGAHHAVVVKGDAVALVELPPEETWTELRCLDTLASLHDVPGTEPLQTGDRHRLDLLIAAQLAGLATAAAEQSVAYAKDREQFGQPIGAFQAVKHRCADMAVRAEAARTQVHYAALAFERGLPDAEFQVGAAAIVAGRAAIDNAEINVQNHGGIGFTWEHTAHRIVTRTRILTTFGGGLARHESQLVHLAGPS
jgi:alkylation response protein AidB-like acyl-CoA dehydrogenase